MRLVPEVVAATPFAAMPIGLEDDGEENPGARSFCTIEEGDTDPNVLLSGFIRTAFTFLQPPTGCLRISIAPQTLRLDLPCWPASGLELPAGPVTSIVSVKYFDQSNVEQTIDPAQYFADNDALIFADTFAAPAHSARPSAVQITYDAGAEEPFDNVKTAMLLMVKHWYDNRDAVQAVGALSMMPLGIDDLIATWRVR